MKPTRWRSRAMWLFLVAGLARAHAGPTLMTEDPGTPGAGRWEINFAVQHERRAGDRLTAGPIADFNYGFGERLQLKYEAAWLWSRPADGPPQDGVSNSLAGVKWRFWENEKTGRAASIFPQLEFRTAGSRSARKGLAPDEETLLLPVQWRETLSGVALLVEAGRALPRASAGSWYGGIACLRALPNGMELAVELSASADHRLHRSELVANLAALVPLNGRMGLLLTVGRELHNHTGPPARFIAYMGVQLSR